MATRNLVLRTMYIDPDVDDQLRTEAFDSRTSKNDLLRKYLRKGMEVARAELKAAAGMKSTATADLDVIKKEPVRRTAPGPAVAKKAPAKKPFKNPGTTTAQAAPPAKHGAAGKKGSAKPAVAA